VRVLLKRAFYQGYSKALLRKLNGSIGSMDIEKSYLKTLVFRYIPQRMKRAYRLAELKKGGVLVASITSVGLGFAYGSLKKVFPGDARNINNPYTTPSRN